MRVLGPGVGEGSDVEGGSATPLRTTQGWRCEELSLQVHSRVLLGKRS